MQIKQKEFLRKSVKSQDEIEEIASIVVDSAFRLHKDLGPGLLESVYEVVLAKIISDCGLKVDSQVTVPVCYQGIILKEGFRLDLFVNRKLVVELKSVETFHPVHYIQLLTYLRLMDKLLELLINFGDPLLKDDLKRVVNNHIGFASSCT